MPAEGSNKPLKVSNIFRRTLEAESIGLEKIPSQSPTVTLCTGGKVRSPAPNACKSAALETDLANSEKVQIHELAVQGVSSEPVSPEFPVKQGKNREFQRIWAIWRNFRPNQFVKSVG